MKKLTALFLALALCLSLCTVTAFAAVDGSGTQADPWKIGKSGHESDVTAYWDNNTLYIQGTSTGEMKDFALPSDDSPNPAPWANYPISAVSIGSGVTKIGGYAFTGTNISSIIIPANVTWFGEGAFYDCDSITNVTFEAKTNIKNFAFQNCDNLTSVTMKSATPPTLGTNAFANCPNLKIFVPADNVETYKTTVGWSNYVDKITTLWEIGKTAGTDNVTAYLDDNGTLHIEGAGEMMDFTNANDTPWKDSRSSIKEVVIGSGVTSIGNYAFQVCKSLTSVTIPESVKNIGDNAFGECMALANVTIAEGVTSIGQWAFYYCTSLTSVTVEAPTPPTLGTAVFTFCDKLEKIYVPTEKVNAYQTATNWSNYAEKIMAVAPATFTVTVSPAVHGTVTATPTDVASGTDVTLTVTPDSGYKLDSLTVTKKGGGTVTVTGNTFTMPADDVTVAATFAVKSTPHHYDGGTTTPTVSAPKTADAGIALYGVLSVSSLLGMGWVGKKKHNEE